VRGSLSRRFACTGGETDPSGAFAGNEIQKKHDQPVPGQQIIVRTGNGVLVSITQPVDPGVRTGQRVYVEGSGDGARVVPRQ
jgi:outer membrane lipoprotein SlyB